jgi:hypothetical protein
MCYLAQICTEHDWESQSQQFNGYNSSFLGEGGKQMATHFNQAVRLKMNKPYNWFTVCLYVMDKDRFTCSTF